jgi:hypothetical protein
MWRWVCKATLMTSLDSKLRAEQTHLGAALGAIGGTSAYQGAAWSGIGDPRPLVAAIAILVGAGLGALTWSVFMGDRDNATRPDLVFGAGFGASIGLLAGAFAAFPVGGVFGAVGGGVGAFCGLLYWRWSADRVVALNGLARPLATVLVGSTAGSLFAWWMTT